MKRNTKTDSYATLDTNVTFTRNVAEPDWTGHPGEPDWQDQFTVAAGITFSRGGEAVLAARLTARQPAILRVRVSEDARKIEPDWRCRSRDGEVFQIREKPRVARDNRGYLEMLVEAGVND